MHYHRLLRDGTCAVNYGKHTLFHKGREHLCLSIGSRWCAPSSRPSLMLFLWFPKLLLDTVKFGTGHRACSASSLSLAGASCLSAALWQAATPSSVWRRRWLATVPVNELWLVDSPSCYWFIHHFVTVVEKKTDSFFISLFEFLWEKDMFCGGKVKCESEPHSRHSQQPRDVTETCASLLLCKIAP